VEVWPGRRSLFSSTAIDANCTGASFVGGLEVIQFDFDQPITVPDTSILPNWQIENTLDLPAAYAAVGPTWIQLDYGENQVPGSAVTIDGGDGSVFGPGGGAIIPTVVTPV
jgi:hypothetical protein